MKDGDPAIPAVLQAEVEELRRTVADLRRNDAGYRTLFEILPQLVWHKDRDSVYVTANLSYCRAIGVSPDRIVGRTDFDFYPRELAEKYRADDRHIMDQAVIETFEEKWIEGGRDRSLRTTKLPVRNAQGEICGTLGIAEDVTEQRRVESRLKLLVAALDAAANAIVITDRDGVVEWANPAFSVLTGHAPEETVGRRIADLTHSGVQGREFYAEMWRTILGGGVWQGELVNRRKDGSRYPELLTITPVMDAHGTIQHFVAVKQDDTERRQMEDRLRQSQKMEAIGQLAGGVSHDFNNLLSVINGAAELALERLAPGDAAREDLQGVLDAGNRAADLTRQLLAFSRKQMLAPEIIDLNEVIGRIQKMLARLISEDIVLSTELAPDLGKVKADRGQMEQVIMNLAINARDAMPLGGRLTLETWNLEPDASFQHAHPDAQPGPHVVLVVTDTGSGMDPETQARIFEPFFTTKGMGRGTGLGLATVYGIVRQSGGFIGIRSDPGKGTTFRVYLPRASAASMAGERRAVTGAGSGGTETILVVEDEGMLRNLVVRMLGRAGYHVLVAAGGDEALELVRNHPGDLHLLLTDVIMPSMSGRALAGAMAPLRPGLKVLYMSGYTDDVLGQHGVLDRGVQFIAKPFTRDQLVGKVRELLDS